MAALPGGATQTLYKGAAPYAGTVVAVVFSDVPLVCTLSTDDGAAAETGPAVVLSAPVLTAGDTVTLTAKANSGPAKRIAGSVTLNIPANLSLADLAPLFTDTGQLLVGSGFHTALLLPIGAGGSVLTVDPITEEDLIWAAGAPIVWQGNGTPEATEGAVNFVDGGFIQWFITDDAANSRAQVKAAVSLSRTTSFQTNPTLISAATPTYLVTSLALGQGAFRSFGHATFLDTSGAANEVQVWLTNDAPPGPGATDALDSDTLVLPANGRGGLTVCADYLLGVGGGRAYLVCEAAGACTAIIDGAYAHCPPRISTLSTA